MNIIFMGFYSRLPVLIVFLLPLALLDLPHAQAQDAELIFVAQEDLDAFWVATKQKIPTMPTAAARNKIEGCIRVGFIIESNGSVSTIRRLAEAPFDSFWRNTKKALSRWRFEPGEKNPQGDAVYTESTYTFHLADANRKLPPNSEIEGLAGLCNGGLPSDDPKSTATTDNLGPEQGSG